MEHTFKLMIAILLVGASFLCACKGGQKTASNKADGLVERVVNMMVGDFSSQAQSLRDSDYFDIRLHIHPIWTADKANHWLYVEQATAAAENKPYRQRIYKVEADGQDGVKSIVYTLPEPEKWIGGHKNPSIFDQLKPTDLTLREGCTVFLKKQNDGTFSGSTKANDCESTLRGAKYATSTVTVTSKQLLSWDQGFNAEGKQVWGATKGGYAFVKTKK